MNILKSSLAISVVNIELKNNVSEIFSTSINTLDLVCLWPHLFFISYTLRFCRAAGGAVEDYVLFVSAMHTSVIQNTYCECVSVNVCKYYSAYYTIVSALLFAKQLNVIIFVCFYAVVC
jgi:hypothetical protein